MENWKNDWGNLTIIILPILASLAPLLISELYWLILTEVVIIIFIFFGWLQTNFQKDSINEWKQKFYKTEHERDHLLNSIESIPEEVIKHLFFHWNLSYRDRITIYRYNEDSFIPVGRFSVNRELKKLGRNKYPKEVGFIGKAWNDGYFYVDNLPEYEGNEKLYIDLVSEMSGMKKNELKKITMKSRTYYCKTLMNNGLSIAVIVVESLDKVFPNKDIMYNDLKGYFGKVLVSTIELNLPAGKGDQ